MLTAVKSYTSNVCHVCYHMRDNDVETIKFYRFEVFTLKIKVKNVDDLDGNW